MLNRPAAYDFGLTGPLAPFHDLPALAIRPRDPRCRIVLDRNEGLPHTHTHTHAKGVNTGCLAVLELGEWDAVIDTSLMSLVTSRGLWKRALTVPGGPDGVERTPQQYLCAT